MKRSGSLVRLALGAGVLLPSLTPLAAQAQMTTRGQGKWHQSDKFRQLEEVLPTPTEVRLASGAPGPDYWQQRADYDVDVTLDDQSQRIIGSERVTYHNLSPHRLRYLWIQLEQNLFARGSDGALAAAAPDFPEANFRPSPEFNPRRSGKLGFFGLRRLLAMETSDAGYNITRIVGADARPLPHVVVGTMMRLDLPVPLEPGESTVFEIDWDFNIIDAKSIPMRQGYEYFSEDGNYLYEMAHWFPRLAAYTDVNGWQHKQFLGRGEFTLEFGDYDVRITVPDDHIVASTGVLQNPDEVLTQGQRDRLRDAESSPTPMFIVSPEEAEINECNEPKGTKTWHFVAEDVRDFAFASSRKFIWDAQGHYMDGNLVMAMSFYPKEGEPLWSRYSTHSIIHTLNVFSKYTFNYPYPVAISVNGPIGGMEYPMICYNGPRPEEDGTYTKRTKYGLIGVIIHEVGHNYFPMIVNSDERQWTWMDEGLNTFVQYLAEQEWEDEYPSRRGEPQDITGFMRSPRQMPIMTNSESLLNFGANAYAKPATALNILRETILGRELFDFAFKEYAQRWMFKRPQPSDFFRTMEDASGVDLDWFWRGWFYSTDHVDIAITGLSLYEMDTGDPDIDKARRKSDRKEEPETVAALRNKDLPKRADDFPELLDFYNEFDELDVTPKDLKDAQRWLDSLDPWERDLLETQHLFYVAQFENVGGLVMPILLDIEYVDGSHQEMRIPAEIWRYNNEKVEKLILARQEIRSVTVDRRQETADVDMDNNTWPPEPATSRFKLFKQRDRKNPMQLLNDSRDDDDLDEPADVDENGEGANKAAAAPLDKNQPAKKRSDSGAE